MKPDAWTKRVQDGGVYFDEYEVDSTWTPLYSAATIRKWLSECTEEMWRIGMNTEGGTDDKYRAMIAVKLKELETK
jgi:hypothetical protein